MKQQGVNNRIHPTAIIGNDVVMGNNNEIGPYAIIEGHTVIGDNNEFGPFTRIGCPPTDNKHIEHDEKRQRLVIGNGNVIREYCVVEQPCYEEQTLIGDNTFLMQGVHVSHDVHLYDHAVVTNQTVLAGIVKVLEGANIAMAVTVNQYTVIGQYSIAATNAAVMKNIRPFSRYIPGKPSSVNYYALKKFGLEEYTGEVERYVLEHVAPVSERIKSIVDEFDRWVAFYGRKTYE